MGLSEGCPPRISPICFRKLPVAISFNPSIQQVRNTEGQSPNHGAHGSGVLTVAGEGQFHVMISATNRTVGVSQSHAVSQTRISPSYPEYEIIGHTGTSILRKGQRRQCRLQVWGNPIVSQLKLSSRIRR